MAPPRGQVAEHPLPPLWLTQYSLPVRDSKDTGHSPKCAHSPGGVMIYRSVVYNWAAGTELPKQARGNPVLKGRNPVGFSVLPGRIWVESGWNTALKAWVSIFLF